MLEAGGGRGIEEAGGVVKLGGYQGGLELEVRLVGGLFGLMLEEDCLPRL